MAAARLMLEGTATEWPWWSVVLLALAASVAGGTLAAAASSPGRRSLPPATAMLVALPPLVYVVWPWPDPPLGWLALGLVAVTAAWLLAARLARGGLRRRVDLAVGLSLFCGSLALYVRTLAPSVLGADSGEFQFVPYVLGIAHPPGYPLYTLLGKLFTYLPFGSPAYDMNLMSAAFGAATVALLYGVIIEAGRWAFTKDSSSGLGVRAGAAVAALTFALTPTWWNQASIAAVRTMTGFFVALTLWLALRWWRRGDWRWLAAAAFAFTLGFTHHVSLVAAGLALVILAVALGFWHRLGWRRTGWTIVWALVPLLVYLYLPIRSAMGSPFDPAHPTTLERFLDLVLAQGFRGDMFHYGWADMPQRSELLVQLLVLQIGYPGLVLAALGFAALLRRSWPAALLLGVTGAVNIGMGITYRAPVIADYLIPAYLVLCAGIGIAVMVLIQSIGRLWHRFAAPDGAAAALTASLLAFLLLGPGVSLFPSMDLSGYRDVERFARDALSAARPGSVILTDWFSSTALWYYQLAEGQRPDVEVKYVYPEGEGMPWAKRAAEEVPQRTIYLSNYDPQVAERYRLMPVGPLAEARAEPSFELPPGITERRAELDGKVLLAGYRLPQWSVRPGEPIRLGVYWQALQKMDRSYVVFVHLADAEGNVWGQQDGPPVRGRYPTDRWVPGEVVGDQYELLVLPSVPPGEYRLLVGMYETPTPTTWRRLPVLGEGTDAVELARIRVQGEQQRRAPIEFPAAANFGNRMDFLGAEVDEVAGGSVSFTLFWRARQPFPRKLDVLAKLEAGGEALGEGEQAVDVSSWQPGDLHYQGWTLPLPGDAPAWDLSVAVRDADGQSIPLLGPWMLPAGEEARLSMHRDEVAAPGRVRANFGDQALLMDYRLEPAAASPGSSVDVVTRWLPLWRIDEDYSLFVHLLDRNGKILAQRDATPVHGGLPTLRWAAGREVTDRRTLVLPPDLAPGEYWFQVGLYPLTTGQRVPVLDQRRAKAGQGDRVLIGPLQVK